MSTLLTINGVPDGPKGIAGGLQTIYVHDNLVLDSTGTILSLSDTFTQVPEPSSLALMGLGVAALGVWARRRIGA